MKTNTKTLKDAVTVTAARAGKNSPGRKKTGSAEAKEMAVISWTAAQTLLWNDVNFSVAEREAVLKILEGRYLDSFDADRNFSNFCQRLALAAAFREKTPGCRLPLPSVCFASNQDNLFTETAEWFQEIERVRRSIPNYKKPLRVFAKAVLAYGQSRSPLLFQFWRNYFIDHDEYGMLRDFSLIAANYQLDTILHETKADTAVL